MGSELNDVRKSAAKRIGQRNTRQRRAVIAAMDQNQAFRSAADIHHQLVTSGEKVGLTTVYRTLQSLADIQAVDVIHQSNGESLFRLCSSHHHHHLVCTSCGETVEITGGPVEKWAESLAAKYGFSLTGHSAEVFGLCANCQSEAAAADATDDDAAEAADATADDDADAAGN